MTETEPVLPPEEDVSALEEESLIRKKEGSSSDPAAMQTALCIILAIGLIALNMTQPELAGAIFSRLKELSADTNELIPDPIGLLFDFLKSL